jgi:hypothetical protein
VSRAVESFVGQSFSHWTVVAEVEPKQMPSGTRQRRVQVRCPTCEAEQVVELAKLKAVRVPACLHGARPARGLRFGRSR